MFKIDKILIGTHNKGKFREISDLLPAKIYKISPNSLNIKSPDETGKTFAANSLLKAKYFYEKSKLVTLSDDSGLEIECLNNQPGIYSARWAKDFGGFDNAMTEILKKIKKINKGTRARFISSLTIYWDNKKFITEVGKIEGNITEKKGLNGFGYDPIFVPKGYKKTFAELVYDVKNNISHRAIATEELKKILFS